MEASLVGMTGFEPATTRPPAECATGLRHIPRNQIALLPLFWKEKRDATSRCIKVCYSRFLKKAERHTPMLDYHHYTFEDDYFHRKGNLILKTWEERFLKKFVFIIPNPSLFS